MKKPIIVVCVILLIAAATVAALTLGGCGTTSTGEPGDSAPEEVQTTEPESTVPTESTTDVQEESKALKDLLDEEAAKDSDFDRNTYERVDFATDGQGTEWAIVEVKTYTKSAPDEGVFEAHVFKQVDGKWQQVSAGSSGYSEGVPAEVQQELDIEGQ